jgi:hypothetical protein
VSQFRHPHAQPEPPLVFASKIQVFVVSFERIEIFLNYPVWFWYPMSGLGGSGDHLPPFDHSEDHHRYLIFLKTIGWNVVVSVFSHHVSLE